MAHEFLIQLCVVSAPRQQLRVGATFDNLTALQHENLPGMANGGQPVGNHERRSIELI